MNICVIATAAKEFGALSIYLQFLNQLKQDIGGDKYLIIVDPGMPHEDIYGVTYADRRTSKLERVKCDFREFGKIIESKNFRPDILLSFQNCGIRLHNVKQLVYFHNSLPITNERWSFFKSKQERKLFFYKYIYYHYIKFLLHKNDTVVVQARFLKKAFARRFNFPEKNIYVLKPTLNNIGETKDIEPYTFEETDKYNFIYPAVEHLYKNHILLAEALKELNVSDAPLLDKIRIHLTIRPEQNASFYHYIRKHHLLTHFVFHGKIPQSELFQMYKASIALLFPSYIETVGLPQIEAAAFGLPIVVSDSDYSHEVLQNYEGATYLSHVDPLQWAKAIKKICRKPKHFHPWHADTNNSWHELFNIIHSS